MQNKLLNLYTSTWLTPQILRSDVRILNLSEFFTSPPSTMFVCFGALLIDDGEIREIPHKHLLRHTNVNYDVRKMVWSVFFSPSLGVSFCNANNWNGWLKQCRFDKDQHFALNCVLFEKFSEKFTLVCTNMLVG